MRALSFSAIVLLFFTVGLYAQESNLRVGTSSRVTTASGAFYDYSDPSSVNMKIAIWGYVRNPGRYAIPLSTTIIEAISNAGGPVDDALLEDVRLLRMKPDSTQEVIKFDYNQLLHESAVAKTIKDIQLRPGDVLLIPGEPRFYFKDYFSITLSIISTLISLTILIISLVKK